MSRGLGYPPQLPHQLLHQQQALGLTHSQMLHLHSQQYPQNFPLMNSSPMGLSQGVGMGALGPPVRLQPSTATSNMQVKHCSFSLWSDNAEMPFELFAVP